MVGDLNEDLLNMNYRNLRDILLIHSMNNVINYPTRQNAILDPIIIHDDMPYTDCGVIDTPPNNNNDHKAAFLIIPFHYEYKVRRANFEELRHQLRSYNRDFLTDGSLEEACTSFTNIFLDMVQSCVPSKQMTVRQGWAVETTPNFNQWFKPVITALVNTP